MLTRVYVCGRTCIDAPGAFLDEAAFPARQGRLAWTYLVLERERTVTRDEIIGAVWGHDTPEASDRSLSSILSKLRALLQKAGMRDSAIHAMGPTLRLALESGVWIDWETAHADLERATRLFAQGNAHEAYGWALAAYLIAREDLLPGVEAPWLVSKRTQLTRLLARAIDELIAIYRATANLDMAVQFAEEAVMRDPLRESSYQRLFDLYAETGSGSALMAAYKRCREILNDELQCSPSPATQAAYRRALDAIGLMKR